MARGEIEVRKSFIVFIAFLLALLAPLALPERAVLAELIPAEGGVFPDLTLPLPQRVDERDYLGISKGPFKLSQIGADVLIVEIFSMYCPYCQKEAPNVNALCRAIESRPGLKEKIKLIGIGAGNTAFEVDAFRKLYTVPFPLFQDAEYSVHKTVGEVRTPYFFVIKKGKDASNRIVYSQVGSFGEPDAFLDLVLDRTGMPGRK
jgi:thiol-disulfide isomerase/thioredoxin